MLISCSSVMVPGVTLTDKAEHLAAWGYDAIAVFQDRDTWTPSVHRELASLEGRTGVRPVEFVLMSPAYGKAMATDPHLRAECRDMYRETVDVCAELGLVTEIEFEYGPQDPMPLFDPYRQPSAEQEDEFVEFYLALLQRAEGSAAMVLLETLNRYESRFLNTVADNLRVLDRVDHANAGLLPDTFHMSIEESSVPQAIRDGARHIRHVHLGDNNRLLPGHGALDWPAIFRAIHDVGYTGTVNLECSAGHHPDQTLPEALTLLRALIRTN